MSTPIYDAMIREQRWRELTRTAPPSKALDVLIRQQWPLHPRSRTIRVPNTGDALADFTGHLARMGGAR